MHERIIKPSSVAKMFGLNVKDKRIKKYADLMEQEIKGFGNGGRYRLYTEKEVEVLRYIFRRVAEGANLTTIISDAVSIFYESTVVVFG